MTTIELNLYTAFSCIDYAKQKLFEAKTEEDEKTARNMIKDVEEFLDRIEIGKLEIGG